VLGRPGRKIVKIGISANSAAHPSHGSKRKRT
jgi:hypothetical protein